MLVNDPSTIIIDSAADRDIEPPFSRFVRSTLTTAMCRNYTYSPYLSLASHGRYDIMTFAPAVVEAYQWDLIYCRPTRKQVEGVKKCSPGLLIIGEAVGDDLTEVMVAAGLGTKFMVIGGGEYRKFGLHNRSGWIFDPSTTSIECQFCVGWSPAAPDWLRLGETVDELRVMAALRI